MNTRFCQFEELLTYFGLEYKIYTVWIFLFLLLLESAGLLVHIRNPRTTSKIFEWMVTPTLIQTLRSRLNTCKIFKHLLTSIIMQGVSKTQIFLTPYVMPLYIVHCLEICIYLQLISNYVYFRTTPPMKTSLFIPIIESTKIDSKSIT